MVPETWETDPPTSSDGPEGTTPKNNQEKETGKNTHTHIHTHRHSFRYLLYFRLQRAVQWSRLHMLRDQVYSPQNMEGQLLFNWAEVTSGYIFVL